MLITHAVPAARVRRLVPQRFELQTRLLDGEETAFISTSCFCNRDLRWSHSSRPSHTFNQNTFRTYVTYRGRDAAYFFGDYVDTRSSYVVQKALTRGTQLARIEVAISRGDSGYAGYSCRADASGQVLAFDVTAQDAVAAKDPFTSAEEHAQFITYRLHGLSTSPFGIDLYGPIDHRRMQPFSGRLHAGRFDFWSRLGILEEDRYLDAFSVLVEPEVRFTLFPPRLA